MQEHTADHDHPEAIRSVARYAKRTSDLQLPKVLNTIGFACWCLSCLIGAAIAIVTENPLWGGLVIAGPTLLGMVIKPSFGLCLMMAVLPFGAGVAIPGVFTLTKGVGLALALTFAANLVITQPALKWKGKEIRFVMAYFLWAILSCLVHPFLESEALRALTQLQLMVLFLVVYWILDTNKINAFVWTLRSYLLGTAGSIALALYIGIQVGNSPEGRFTAALGGGQINANHYGALVGLAFLAAFYLLHKETRLSWVILYAASIPFLAIMLVRIGSRGSLLGVMLALLISYIHEIRRNPRVLIGIVSLAFIVVLAGMYYLHNTSLDEKLLFRLTDMGYAVDSMMMRMDIVHTAIDAALQWPLGTGYMGWFERTGEHHVPHSDLFFVLAMYGWPGMILFASLMVVFALHLKRMPYSHEKLFSKLVFFFILLIGLKGGYMAKKFFWAFLAFMFAAGQYGLLLNAAKGKMINSRTGASVRN